MRRAAATGRAQEAPYLLGTGPGESHRLETQHRLWADSAHELWDRANFGAGKRLVDLGCGPGFAALELAERVGAAGQVLAVDRSERFIAELVREAERRGLAQLTAQVGEVEEFRLEPGSLDGAFARWLFCFLPAPGPVVERVVSALRPGGRLVVWDYLNYRATTLHPPSPAFERVVSAVHESWRRSGGDLDLGGRLPAVIASAGCRILDLVPLTRFARPGTPLWQWPSGFFLGYVPRLVAAGLLSEMERRSFEAEWREREREPGAFLSLPPMVGVVAEKL